MRLTELFNHPTAYTWKNKNKWLGTATFEIGDVSYQVDVEEDEVDSRFWLIGFGTKVDGTLRGDTTGTGNQFAVYSTVVAVARDYMQEYGIRPLRIVALDDSRKSLYPKMLKRLLPDWSITIASGNIIVIPPQ